MRDKTIVGSSPTTGTNIGLDQWNKVFDEFQENSIGKS